MQNYFIIREKGFFFVPFSYILVSRVHFYANVLHQRKYFAQTRKCVLHINYNFASERKPKINLTFY